MQFELKVNGETRRVEVPEGCSLLEVLRNDLGITSPKFGCGLGQCGACFVWIDGHPRSSCDLPVEYVGDADVRTLEGTDPDALQATFLELQAGQCGYCLSGVLVSAAALLRDNPRPNREDVRAALDRNLCRCGTQQRFVDAVLAASESAP